MPQAHVYFTIKLSHSATRFGSNVVLMGVRSSTAARLPFRTDESPRCCEMHNAALPHRCGKQEPAARCGAMNRLQDTRRRIWSATDQNGLPNSTTSCDYGLTEALQTLLDAVKPPLVLALRASCQHSVDSRSKALKRFVTATIIEYFLLFSFIKRLYNRFIKKIANNLL